MTSAEKSAFTSRQSLEPGQPYPLGATIVDGGVNFAVYSEHATRVILCLFDGPDSPIEHRFPLSSRSGHVWHGFLPGAGAGQVYGYRIEGPWDPAGGQLFNQSKLLIDPYANALTGEVAWNDCIFGYRRDGHPDQMIQSREDSSRYVPRSVVIDHGFDWEGVESPRIPQADMVIYETHVKGMTAQHPQVPEELRGTYAGFAHPAVLEHLKSLGVTSIELLPIQAFVDEEFLVQKELKNYWGYNTIGFFAPAPRYALASEGPGTVEEVKQLVKELHRNGFEVLLDVVYNHTAEGGGNGPTLSFRGIDNRTYYKLNPANLMEYRNYSGTGNTINIGHPAALRLVLDSLRHWVTEYRIDGFRFDLAPALGRDDEQFSDRATFFTTLSQDPVLAGVKLIAEPWDLGPNGYQVGHFPVGWSEWNDKFRDSMRSFWLGHPQTIGEFALRMSGSSDLYDKPGRGPLSSVNYVTCHDGFTLLDLVSHDQKHNEANQEDNDDGHNHNLSRNFGAEGSTDDPEIKARRNKARRNLIACTLLSHGLPMMLGGDELSRTQRGNNNAYSQDNELNWFDWSEKRRDPSFEQFIRLAIRIRREFPHLRFPWFASSETPLSGMLDEPAWKEPDGRDIQPHEWGRHEQRALSLYLGASGAGDSDLAFLFNAGQTDVEFTLPESDEGWRSILDTTEATGEPPTGALESNKVNVRSESLLIVTNDGEAGKAS